MLVLLAALLVNGYIYHLLGFLKKIQIIYYLALYAHAHALRLS